MVQHKHIYRNNDIKYKMELIRQTVSHKNTQKNPQKKTQTLTHKMKPDPFIKNKICWLVIFLSLHINLIYKCFFSKINTYFITCNITITTYYFI